MVNPKVSETNLAIEWDYENNILGPENYTTGSDKKVYWKCLKCKLSYETATHSRFGKNPSNCPFCARQKASYFYNLETLFPKISQSFNTVKNNVSPKNITPGSKKNTGGNVEKDMNF